MAQVESVEDAKRDERKSKQSQNGYKSVWKGFVDVELSKHDKTEIKKLMDKYGEAWSEVHGMVVEGYKLTLSYDDNHNVWTCSLTGRGKDTTNEGYTLTGRGGSMQAAVVCFVYKHQRLLQGNWSRGYRSDDNKLAEDDVL